MKNQTLNRAPSWASWYLIDNFEELFSDKDIKSISSEDIFHFLAIITENSLKHTKRRRYSQLRAFFNFI
ncbi:MAG: hypothetical protein AMK74_00400 [Nitrospira bacterium SM23_35]|nr:MAG: hypothetical protein AMK74_00400 [Nitrospira bacterium SM23_35]